MSYNINVEQYNLFLNNNLIGTVYSREELQAYLFKLNKEDKEKIIIEHSDEDGHVISYFDFKFNVL